MKIGLIIPVTSNKRDWKTIEETYLYNYTLKTFLLTYNKNLPYKHCFYIGYDAGDKIFDNMENQNKFIRFINIMKNVSIEFICLDHSIPKGHVTIMWNQLFKYAYDEGCDYFVQIGDDIKFKTNNWLFDCVSTIQNKNNIGMAGPVSNNTRILTQSVVSRKHMEIFNYYFPPSIKNWFCDDWLNEVYNSKNMLYVLNYHYCENAGGEPRYNINNDADFNKNIRHNFNVLKDKSKTVIDEGKMILHKYLKKKI